MSDNAPNGTPTGGGDAKKWTEAEKYHLLLKIMTQLTEAGGKIQPAKLAMPNRTAKSLSHMITAFKKEAAQLEAGAGAGSAPATPVKKRAKAGTGATPTTNRKRVLKADSEDEFDDTGSHQATPPAKRQRLTAGTPKKAPTASDPDAKPMFPSLSSGNEDPGI
ncbi:hypothetical protein F4775DRAFT_596630 [Biscogniauxia sp. FL1348]|nr:hypothetical protein F4775DRAFT_596630 [Biscogniauxia sp. FL1348]